MLKNGFKVSDLTPCIFTRKDGDMFVLVSIYVDDINIIGDLSLCDSTAITLSTEFEMKDLGKTTFCLGIQLDSISGGVLMHQTTYTKKMLEKFSMDACTPVSTPMIGRSLDKLKDPLRPRTDEEEILDPTLFPYLSAIGALLYLAITTRPDISFSVNFLARFSREPTKRHWDAVKRVFAYLKGTVDYGLFHRKVTSTTNELTAYADAGYLSDPHRGLSQNGYVLLYNGTPIV